MKICMVTDTFWPRINGVSVSVTTLTRALRALGQEVYIAAPDYESLPARRNYIDGDRTPLNGVIRFPTHPVLFFPEDGLTRLVGPGYHQQRSIIQELGFDIVHTHTPLVLGTVAVYWQLGKHVPLIHTFHTLLEDFMPFYFPFCYMPPRLARGVAHWVSLNAFHWYCNHFDCVIAPSSQVAELLQKYYLCAPVEVVPSGIEVERFQGGDGERIRDEWHIAPEEKLLLFAGRVCYEKNIELILRAVVHIQERVPLARLVIVGRGPAEEAMKRLAHELGIESRVLFAGYRPYSEMTDIHAAADLFLFSSQTETQGLVTVEAMASGTPVVAVRGPGTLDLLENEKGGLLSPPEEEAFANQVIRLLDDRALYACKVTEARERARVFSSLAMARRVLGIYESLLERQPEKHLGFLRV